jgi:hypothetical protein
MRCSCRPVSGAALSEKAERCRPKGPVRVRAAGRLRAAVAHAIYQWRVRTGGSDSLKRGSGGLGGSARITAARLLRSVNLL